MDSTVSPRFVTGLVALLFCLVASLRTGDTRPARMVTEVVSIAMVSPRAAQAVPPADPAAGVLRLAASGGENGPSDPMGPMAAERWQPLTVPPVPVPAPPARRNDTADRPVAAPPATGKPAAKAPTQVARATPAAKPRAPGKVRPHTRRAPVLAQATPSSPQVPAVFEPLRRLGLSIQARLPAAPADVSPATKPAQPGGAEAV